MKTKAKNPELTSGVIVGGSGIQRVGKACILVWSNGLKFLPNAVAMVGMVVMHVVLGF